MLGMQAEMTPMHGSAADQMAASTKSQVKSTLVRRPRTMRRMMLMMQTLEDRSKQCYALTSGVKVGAYKPAERKTPVRTPLCGVVVRRRHKRGIGYTVL